MRREGGLLASPDTGVCFSKAGGRIRWCDQVEREDGSPHLMRVCDPGRGTVITGRAAIPPRGLAPGGVSECPGVPDLPPHPHPQGFRDALIGRSFRRKTTDTTDIREQIIWLAEKRHARVRGPRSLKRARLGRRPTRAFMRQRRPFLCVVRGVDHQG